MAPGLHDVADFLRAHPPFDSMGEAELDALARAAEIEYFAAGTVIFGQSAPPRDSSFVLRTGAVELLDGDRLIDLLGPGELFGHRSMLSEQPTRFAARAHADSLCYRLPADVVRPLLARPEGLRFVARAMGGPVRDGGAPGAGLSGAPVGSLIHGPPPLCDAGEPIREAARRMTEARTGAIVVPRPEGVGLLTDRDLREHVIAGGVPVDAPVRAVLRSRPFVVRPARRAGEVLLEMLDRGVRHVCVCDDSGRPVGLLRTGDLLAAQTRAPFVVRDAIERAGTPEELRAAAARVRPAALELVAAGVDAEQVGAVLAIVTDALQRRALEHAQEALGGAPVPFSWMVTGSMGRREPALSSDLDCCLVWDDAGPDAGALGYFPRLAERVLESLRDCGVSLDDHGATARDPLAGRPLSAWRGLVSLLRRDPLRENGLVAIALVLDSRPLATGASSPLDPLARSLAGDERVASALRRAALTHRPPTGFFRDAVVGHGGHHGRALDLKRHGLIPVAEIARWASVRAGRHDGSTRERLGTARSGGVLGDDDARTLVEAFDLLSELCLSHQAEQIQAGLPADDSIDPATLNRLSRSYLRDAFRAVDAVQRRVVSAAPTGAL